MIKIFDKNTTSFNNMGLGVLQHFVTNPIITEVLNGEYIIEFSYSIKGNLSEYLVEENIIEAKDELFKIVYIKKNFDVIEILAKQIVFDLANNFLEDTNIQNKSGVNALSWMLNKTQYSHNYTVNGDNINKASARYVRKDVISAMFSSDNALLKVFGGEFTFNKFNIKYDNKRGSNRNLVIRYGKNLKGINYELDFETVATRILPVAKDGLLLPEKYIDSPKIDNYAIPLIKTVQLDIGVNENTTEEQAYTLIRNEINKLYENDLDVPKISVEIDFVELSKTEEYKHISNLEISELGDTVKIFIPDLNLNYDIRIIKTVYDCIEEKYIKFELGAEIPTIVSSSNNEIKDLTNKLEKVDPTSLLEQAQNKATDLIVNALGGYIYKTNSELYIMDNEKPSLAMKVWRWNINGLGYSKTGISGPFGLAMTMDGAINADYITTGSIALSRIAGLNDTLSGINKAIELNENNIKSSVSKDDLGTEIEQNYDSVIIAWNKVSEFIQFISGTLQIKNEDKNLLMKLDKLGQHFFKNTGALIGSIGLKDNKIAFSVNAKESDSGMVWGATYDNKFMPVFQYTGYASEGGTGLGGKFEFAADVILGTHNLLLGMDYSNPLIYTPPGSNQLQIENVNGFEIGNGIMDKMLTMFLNGSDGYTLDMHNNNITNARNIICLNLIENSKEELKKNIKKYNDFALNKICNTEIYEYNFKQDKDTDKKRIGVVIGNKYNIAKEIISQNNEGIDLYSMISLSYKAIQELNEKIDKLGGIINGNKIK